jgi:hypothetical protein
LSAVAAILRSLARDARRSLGSFRSIQVNNLFLFVYLLIYGNLVSGVRPASSYPFLLLLGCLLLLPLSSDPLARIPVSRMGLWPLGKKQRFALRAASLALSPVLWFTLFLALRARPSLTLVFLATALAAGQVNWSAPRLGMLRGALGWLPVSFRKDLRQMMSVLDTYAAILISLAGIGWRLFAVDPDPGAFPIFAMLVALALSTYTQCLFALDGPGGLTRYRLQPAGWRQILLRKDASWLALLLVLVAPLSVKSGMAFGLTALAIGHYPSLRHRLPLRRWRFAGGRVIFCAAQIVLGATLGFAADRQSPAYLLPAAALYGASFCIRANMRKL